MFSITGIHSSGQTEQNGDPLDFPLSASSCNRDFLEIPVSVHSGTGTAIMMLSGLGFRPPLAEWIRSRPSEIECLEITAEHFFDGGQEQLQWLSEHYPLFIHGLGLSLGSPGTLDSETLRHFIQVVEQSDPMWISEHIAFTQTTEHDLGHLNPVRPTHSNLITLADHARQLSDLCAKPLILENITSYLRLSGEMSEPEFLNTLCSQADCGLLLDVTNLFINAQNHQFDPVEWLHQIEPAVIKQLHIVGYAQRDGQFHDWHDAPIQEDLWELLEAVLEYAPVEACIIERDGGFPARNDLQKDLLRMKDIAHVYR
ncbi:MAG: DUF692 domain-containing protein [Planctomycetota bacterium]|jgi:uncharacterized protein (UPF0276 family)|nr:DUF692 domain-containing protein [Planctomycetota bacterium]